MAALQQPPSLSRCPHRRSPRHTHVLPRKLASRLVLALQKVRGPCRTTVRSRKPSAWLCKTSVRLARKTVSDFGNFTFSRTSDSLASSTFLARFFLAFPAE